MPRIGIGASVKRREDVRFLTGKGRYTDDINRPRPGPRAFLRSDVAHGRIAQLDTAAAAAMPGVLRIFTGEDFADVGGIPCGWQVTDRFGQPMQEPKHPVLAHGKVRHVGDPVAAVVAETLAAGARRGRGDRARHRGAAGGRRHEGGARGRRAQGARRARRRTSASTGASSRTTRRRWTRRSRRRTTSPRSSWSTTGWSRTRWSRAAAIGEYDAADEQHTLYTTSQNPHVIRLLMGAFVLGIPEHKLRVVAPDVGGGFGSKIYHYAEEAFVTFAAQGGGAAGEMDLVAVGGVHLRRARAATT